MQTVNRETLLSELESVTPGLSKREVIEQSACFVFSAGRVCTFNDEVACFQKCSLDLTGAVQAQPLLDLLRKLSDDEISVYVEEGAAAAEFILKGKRGKSGIRFENAVQLPVDKITVPKKWNDIAPDFADAVSAVQYCASGDETRFVLTCVHITPNHIEASDGIQIGRFAIATGATKSMLIRKNALRSVIAVGAVQWQETEEWLWFRNPMGLALGVRRYSDNYPDCSKFLDHSGASPATLPKSIGEVAEKCAIFSSQNATENAISVTLKAGLIVCEGRGATGWYRERRKIDYAGARMEFIMAPELLTKLVKTTANCRIAPGKLHVDSGKFAYVTCLRAPSAQDDEGDDGETTEAPAKKTKKRAQ